MDKILAMALGSLLALVGTSGAMAQEERDLSVQQSQAYAVLPTKQGEIGLSVTLNRVDATYAIGETVELSVKPSKNAYISVWSIGPSGNVVKLFPNTFQKESWVRAGRTITIPDPNSGSQIRVSGPVGAELIKVVATTKRLKLVRDDLLKDAGPFQSLDGGTETLARDLSVAASSAPSDVNFSSANLIIKTIASRATSVPVVVPGQAVVMPGQAVVVPGPALVVPGQAVVAQGQTVVVQPASAQTFPVLLVADKTTYRTGEPITMAVTPTKACYLSVVSIGRNGQARLLFPATAAQQVQVPALQTVMLSGGPSGPVVTAGAPGTDTVLANCTTEPRRMPAARTATEVLADEEKTALERDFATVIAKPAATYGQAQISITVTP